MEGQNRTPKDVVLYFLNDVVNGGNLDLIPQLWTEDLKWHGGSLGDIYGLPAYVQMMNANTQGTFKDMHLTVEEVIVADEKVVVRFTNSGTQIGEFMGTAPTGKHVEWLGIGIYTVHHGKICEAWFGEDIFGMLKTMGIKEIE